MPHPFRQSSIRAKLFRLVIVNKTFILLIVGLFLYGYGRIDTRGVALRALSIQAGIVADSSAAALAFDDPGAATQTLAALRADPNIVEAGIYAQDGRLFASKGNPPPRAVGEGAYFDQGYVSISQPIRVSGQIAGRVYLKASLSEADSRLRRNMGIICLVLLGSLVLSLLLSARMQVSITRPIADLSRVARSVSLRQDFSARAVKSADDEVGFLVDSFNQMLTQIEARDQALRESEERYALAARGSNDGLWDWKLPSDRIYFSPRWNQLLGYDEAETWQSSNDWFERIHPADRERVKAEIAAHREGRSPELATEYRIQQKSGIYIWVLTRGIAVRDADGNAIRLAGSQTDITKGKVADPLTGLPNRLFFLDRLDGVLEVDRRSRRKSAVLFLDMDRFKLVNDSMGHGAGDDLLEGVSDRLRQSLQIAQADGVADASSFVARLGGDEFAVLLNRVAGPEDARLMAERILRDLDSPFRIGGRQVFAGVSIGVALTSAGDTAEELLRNADTAMYHAKTSGKARFAIFDEGMREQAVERLEIETELRKAVGDNQLCLHFQPQVVVADGRLTGFEALVRWNHPERGLVPPDEFISVAEETDLIVPVGQWVLRNACRQMAEWQSLMPLDPPLTVAVNVSVRQLAEFDFVEEVRSVLRETGLSPASLRLEMTESVVMTDPGESIETLRRLKEIGVGLEIDDFGTGYSSLSSLISLPIDTVKIDRSFVSDLGIREESSELVRTILELARSLNLDVVAEGVETEMQLQKLRDLNCARAQGYYFSKPLDKTRISTLIAEESLKRNFRRLDTGTPALPARVPQWEPKEMKKTFKQCESGRPEGSGKEGERNSRSPGLVVALAAVLALLGSLARPAEAQSGPPNSINNATLEDLMNIDVTSVSKKDQTMSRTAAAVFVINQEDIRRSGAANIPDLLRMAPGVEVAQINANQWAISIRGFNAVYSNKVLVLIDGRTVYVDQFSGVYWDQIDVPLEDIERIEVIRGPGGTVWGANAVNGVINIITSSAADTKGGLAVASAGTSQTASGLLQYGGDAGSSGAYRLFGRYFNDSNSPIPGGRAADGGHASHVGFRTDQAVSVNDTLSVQADFMSSEGGETSSLITSSPLAATGVNSLLPDTSGDLLARWEHTLSNGSSTALQISDTAFSRRESGAQTFDNTLDVEFERHLRMGSRNDIVWGFDYRFTTEGIRPVEAWGLQVNPTRRTDSLFAGFAQDEIQIKPSLFLTVGSKIEHNAFTGFEYEPGVQLVWEKSAHQSLWASAARAIREPDTTEHDVQLHDIGLVPVPGVGAAVLVLKGNPALGVERMNDFEIGYRSQLNSRTSLDITGFLSYYGDLVTYESGAPAFASGAFVIPVTPENLGKARDYGLEVFGGWQATSRWKISPGFSLLRMHLAGEPVTKDLGFLADGGDSPKQQFEIRSLLNLRRNLEWDSSLKYVASLGTQNIPAYARLDLRLGWKLGESTELSLSGQNLTSRRHFEFFDNSGLFTASEIARSVFGKLTWRF
jgi:diguanylate cyclase (GGDEF)-like protein/PAS domain S-box-containing protein